MAVAPLLAADIYLKATGASEPLDVTEPTLVGRLLFNGTSYQVRKSDGTLLTLGAAGAPGVLGPSRHFGGSNAAVTPSSSNWSKPIVIVPSGGANVTVTGAHLSTDQIQAGTGDTTLRIGNGPNPAAGGFASFDITLSAGLRQVEITSGTGLPMTFTSSLRFAYAWFVADGGHSELDLTLYTS